MQKSVKQRRLRPVRLDHSWPITDPDVPITDLHEQALEEVKAGAKQYGYRLMSAPRYQIHHGACPILGLSIMAVKR